ncbi:hypothetical protein PHYC_00791 [Phycisphaerales bacterium]|nr:hypothetical protein PHYC_00791 [Phycisphaerales bacterium]
MKTRIAVLAAAALAGIANADVIDARFTGTQKGGTVRVDSPYFDGNVFAGQLKHTLSNGPAELNGNWITYCTDLAQHVTSNTRSYDIVPLSLLPDNVPMGADKASAIRDMYIFANGSQLTTTTSNDLATAFQLAVWEIIVDFNNVPEAGYGLSMTSGDFRARKTSGNPLSSGVMTQLGNLFGAIGDAPQSQIALLGIRSGDYQDQIIPVPAPGAAALAGMGVLLVAGRRREKA